MKKLLLILICLFVSFEVKSKEIILSCKIEYQLIKKDDVLEEIKEPKWEKTLLPFNFYIDLQDQWIGLYRRDYFKNITKSEFDEDDLFITHFLQYDTTYTTGNITIQIQRFNGVFIYVEKSFGKNFTSETKKSPELFTDKSYRGVCDNTSKMKKKF